MKPFGCLVVLSAGYVCVVAKDKYVRLYSTDAIHALLTSVTSLQAVIQKPKTGDGRKESRRERGWEEDSKQTAGKINLWSSLFFN